MNDSSYKIEGQNFVSLSDFENNITQLISQAQKITPKVLFVGLPTINEALTQPVPWAPDVYYTMKNVSEYVTVTQKICTASNIPFVDIFDVLNFDDLEDGIHPNAQGHEKIFQVVKDFLIAN